MRPKKSGDAVLKKNIGAASGFRIQRCIELIINVCRYHRIFMCAGISPDIADVHVFAKIFNSGLSFRGVRTFPSVTPLVTRHLFKRFWDGNEGEVVASANKKRPRVVRVGPMDPSQWIPMDHIGKWNLSMRKSKDDLKIFPKRSCCAMKNIVHGSSMF